MLDKIISDCYIVINNSMEVDMGYIVESYDKDGKQLLGSNGTMLAYDLVTLRGCMKRIDRFHWHPLAHSLRVYRQPYNDRYADKFKVLVKTIFV